MPPRLATEQAGIGYNEGFRQGRSVRARWLGLIVGCLPALTPAADSGTYLKDIRPMLETYCFSCHNAEKKKGDLNLAAIATEEAAQRSIKLWRGVIEQVHSHDMPPDNAKKQPSAEEREKLLAAIKNLKRYDGPLDPGRVTIRRLNRTEYDYTIRDLMGVDLRTARASFPSDDVGEGFDNIGDVLSLPPLLLEKYLDAATTILDKAIVAQPVNIITTAAQLPAIHDGKSLPPESKSGTREFTAVGEVALTVAIPFEGKYNLKISAGAEQAGKDAALLVVKVDNQVVKEFKVTAVRKSPGQLGLPLSLEKGSHRISLHFTNPFTEPAEPKPEPKPEPGKKPGPKGEKNDKPSVRLLVLSQVELLTPTMAGPKPVNKRIFIVEPGPDLKPRDAAQRICENFATLAFRRPVTKEQLDRLMSIFDLAQGQGETFEESVKYTLKAVLVSPAFLYRVEQDRKATLPNNAYPLDDYEMASRLSYFLWSTMPDAELFEQAKQGNLHDAANLEKQARRMLKDSKAHALAETFGEQWLTLRQLETIQPDPKRFPDYNKALKQSMYDETMMFFENIMREDRSIIEFIDCDYTFLNERLAKHYGINNVSGQNMRRVTLTDHNRGGVLGMASVLTVTSQPGRTSPVKRGKWVLEQIIGEPPPPPPPAVPPLAEQGASGTAGLSLRQLMEKHRQDAVCASCHTKMDAIGFGFENFDAIGRWRSDDNGAPLDTAGTLPGGIKFKGPAELKAVFLGRKDAFTRSLTEKMLTFALGRGLRDYDDVVVDRIASAVIQDQYRFSTLVTKVVTSYPFMNRRNQ
jgi:hypothetical protein